MSTELRLQRALDRLEVFGVRLGLRTTRRLLQALGNPQESLRAVLVAGTNGKGSTAALLASMASEAGYRTGLYTSPHLESVTERIRIGGDCLAVERLADIVDEVVTAADAALGYPPTYFEALTAAAFKVFAEEKMDLAVVEVGMGGRLDATNACDPILSLITEIGFEHQSHLGDTLPQIAGEKAGILRPGKTGVVWVEKPAARQAIDQAAERLGTRLVHGPDHVRLSPPCHTDRTGQTLSLRTGRSSYEARLPLLGLHQARNLGLAVLAAEELSELGYDRLNADTICRGAGAATWPGRLEWLEPAGQKPALLDVAHNPDGADTLLNYLADQPSGYVLLFGTLVDKNVQEYLPRLAARASVVVLTRPDSDRALKAADVLHTVTLQADRVILEDDPAAALDAALAAEGEYLVACGSLYLVGQIRRELGERSRAAAQDRAS